MNDKKEKLSPLAFHVTQEKGTEPPFENEYNAFYERGIYVDVVSGEPLFTSTDKFNSHTGWPSFTKPITPNAVEEKIDSSGGIIRTEIVSKQAQSHLGHVFFDGPLQYGGRRYCINSAALRFIPYDQLEQEGYGKWKKRLDDES